MGTEQTERNADEQLAEMHRRARARKKRKLVITICVIVIALIVIVAVGVKVAKSRVDASVSSSTSEIESADATIGSISTTISGSGTLASTDVESIEIVSTVEIVDFYVETGDTVEEGDLIATVTNASLLSAMSDLQSQLDTLDASIEESADDEVSDEITAGASGRVKKIYVSDDDAVADVMYEYGALMLLSLDGYLAVDIETDAVSAGEDVTVTDSDGTAYDGTVESVSGGTAVILISDSSAAYDDEVTVADEDGNSLGSGNLYIHSQIIVTGYAGTVSDVEVSLNESVDAGDTLITLTDTSTSVAYDSLLQEREEVEEQLNNLIAVYKEGGICATIAGTVESLSESGSDTASAMTSSTSGTTSYTTVAEISPDTQMEITISVDETDILSLEVGQEATVTIDSISEDEYTGSVTEISTTATSDSGVTSYTAVVTIDKTEDMLSGMSATAVITIEGVENALLIPVDALHQTSSVSYVYTEYDEDTGEFSGMVEVTTGLSNSSYVEITDGLSEGDTVYYSASSDDETDFSSIMESMGGGSTDSFDVDSSMTMPSGGGDSGSGGSDSGGSMGGGSMPGQ